jgi:hypothetical protein
LETYPFDGVVPTRYFNATKNPGWLPQIPSTEWLTVDTSVRFRCDPLKVKKFWESHDPYKKRSSNQKARTAMEAHSKNLLATKSVLDSLGVQFFLSHGTLLGLYRECDVMSHTNDIDVGIPYKYMM